MHNSKVGGLYFRADCSKLYCVPRRKRDDPDRLTLHSYAGELESSPFLVETLRGS